MLRLIDTWGDAREYKNIKIYPFLMKDYEMFEDLISLLLIDKNSIPNINIIKMSYLKFLLFVLPEFKDNNGKIVFENVFDKFKNFCKYIFKTEKCFLQFKNNQISLNINNKIFNEEDFDKIKKIILNQNAIPEIDDKLHPDLRAAIKESMEFLAKRQMNNEGTIEDQIISYRCITHEKYDDIKQLTIYQFRKEIQRLNLIQDYRIYKTAELSGFVSFNHPIPHWTSHISNDKYDGILMDKKEFENKINNFIN